MQRLLGDCELLAKDGSAVGAASLASVDVVGLYFTALWCPPCRKFTPVAQQVYDEAKRDGRSFEIVQISSDHNAETFEQYRRSVPWLALPFEERDLKERLCKKYRISGVPVLVLVDGKTGKRITRDGRCAITNDPQGFPWAAAAPPIAALGSSLLRGDGTEVQAAVLGGKYTAVFFSASWCKPCQRFTPKLVDAYRRIQERRQDFEVVFVSFDHDEKDFDEYARTMPWLALPFAVARDRASALSEEFGVVELPHIVMLDPQGHVINKDVVAHVAECDGFPWRRQAVRDVAEAALNRTPAVIVFGDAGGALDAPAREAQEGVEAHEDEELVFCRAAESKEGSMAWQVRKLCGLGPDLGKAQMVLLDIPNGGAFYTHEGDVTEQSVRGFVEAYRAGELTRMQLGPNSESG